MYLLNTSVAGGSNEVNISTKKMEHISGEYTSHNDLDVDLGPHHDGKMMSLGYEALSCSLNHQNEECFFVRVHNVTSA